MDRREIGRTAGIVLLAAAMMLLSAPRRADAQAQASMQSRRDYAVGSLPLGVMVTDLDGDGVLDLLTVNQSSDDVSLIRGFGDGTFRPTGVVPTGLRPSGAVLADADGDGKVDLIISSLILREIAFHPGDGLGGFGARVGSAVNASPSGLTVGDWNGDGVADVATANSNSNSVTRLLGDGTGRYITPLQIGVGSGPRSIRSRDMNGDSILDLAFVNNLSNSIQILRGDGAGQFNLATTLSTGAGPNDLAVADLNNDSRPDLATANQAGDSLTVYLANATGGYGTPITLSPGFGPRSLVAADVNADNNLDLVVTLSKVSGVGKVVILTGNGSGGFAAPITLDSGPVPNSVGVGDFNGDGQVDLVTTNRIGNSISVIPSVGGGAFLQAGAISLPSGSFPHDIAVADFNRDLKADVASANEATNNISIASGNGTGGFSAVNSANNVGITPFSIATLDFNRDGNVDLVSANNGDETLSYLQGSGSGNLTVTNGVLSGCEEGTVGISAGDVSGDGIVDIAVVCEVSDEICTRRGTGGTGATAFGAAVCSGTRQNPAGVAVGFYNLDAFEDIAFSATDPGGLLEVAISNGVGGFLDIPTDFPVGNEPKGVATADLNGDGFLDLIVANSGSETISALLGDGGGIFSFPSIDSQAGRAPTDLALADFNLDGKLDVAVTNTNGNNVSLLLGDGLGHFSKAGDFGTRDLPIAVDVGDFDSDGKPDMVVADNFSDTVTILLNRSVPGDPLATFEVLGGSGRTIFRWGLVPGAVYDLIRGDPDAVTEGPASFDLGAVTCLANDLAETDTAAIPDTDVPPVGTIYFYAVRAVVGGVPGNYTVSTGGKPGVPSSGGCP